MSMWRANKIPHTWFASSLVLIHKRKDPQDPKNYQPINVSTPINGILNRLSLKHITKAMNPGLLTIHRGAVRARNNTTLTATLIHNLPKMEGYLALLGVAKPFPSIT